MPGAALGEATKWIVAAPDVSGWVICAVMPVGILTSVMVEDAGAPVTVTTNAAGVPSCVVRTVDVEKARKKPLPTIVTVELHATSTNETRTQATRRDTAARTVETPGSGASCLRKSDE